MDPLAVVTGIGGLALGGYGAWQAHRTSRAVNLLSWRWTLRYVEGYTFELANERPRRASDVAIVVATGVVLEQVDGNLAEVEPGGVVRLVIFSSFGATSYLVTIRWKQGLLRRRRSQVLALPPRTKAS